MYQVTWILVGSQFHSITACYVSTPRNMLCSSSTSPLLPPTSPLLLSALLLPLLLPSCGMPLLLHHSATAAPSFLAGADLVTRKAAGLVMLRLKMQVSGVGLILLVDTYVYTGWPI